MAEGEWPWEVPPTIYEAVFKHNNLSVEVEITVTGHHLVTETDLPISALPAIVREGMEDNFENHKILDMR